MSKEESPKPEPIYHFSDNFSSAYFGKVPPEISGAQNPASDAKLISNFIDLLTNPDKKDLRIDALDTIRKANAQQFLVDLIAMPDQEKNHRDLVMACWETGMDFSKHLLFFSDVVVKADYAVALEAITVIDEMHGLTDPAVVKQAVEMLTSGGITPEKRALASETVERLSNLVE